MHRNLRTFSFLVLVAAGATASPAADQWEGGGFGGDDVSSPNAMNTLSHGAEQEHDLERVGGVDDVDWMIVPTIARHSYEARIHGSNQQWEFTSTCGDFCARFERVDAAGNVLTDDVSVVNEATGVHESSERSVRWIATVSQPDASAYTEYVRVMAERAGVRTETASDVYTIRFWDTTYGIPRWNNSASQITVFLVQNMTQAAVTGQIDLYAPGGALLHTQPFTLAPNALFVFNTATVGALAGQSGHAYVAHTAGYGGLAGKAVALEPATGFSFDTPMAAIPH